MKKFIALLLAAMMLLAATAAFAEMLPIEEAEYDPQPDYDKYCVVEYYIETADATVIVTCNAKADDSQYCMEYSFYGDDQMVVCDPEGKVISDKTGFMSGDTPDMLKAILEVAEWTNIGEEAAPAAKIAVPNADGIVEFLDGTTSEDAEYDPNPDYDLYTVVAYYIETADADVIVTASKKADDSEYSLEYSFYGDDQLVVWDNVKKEIVSDKTGFMGGDTPDMIAFLEENAIWAEIVKTDAAE